MSLKPETSFAIPELTAQIAPYGLCHRELLYDDAR